MSLDLSIIDFPITIPNQPRIDQFIRFALYGSILTSLVGGILTNTLINVFYLLAAQYVLVLLVVLPNWSFVNTEQSIKWLQLKL